MQSHQEAVVTRNEEPEQEGLCSLQSPRDWAAAAAEVADGKQLHEQGMLLLWWDVALKVAAAGGKRTKTE